MKTPVLTIVVSLNKGPQYRFQLGILLIGTAKKVPLILGNLHMGFQEYGIPSWGHFHPGYSRFRLYRV